MYKVVWSGASSIGQIEWLLDKAPSHTTLEEASRTCAKIGVRALLEEIGGRIHAFVYSDGTVKRMVWQ